MALDMFIKLDDIKGESADDKHKGEIDVLSWSWGAAQSGGAHAGGGAGAGKVQVSDLSFTKPVDRSSPVLFSMCAAGTHIKQGLLTVRKAGGKPLEYLKITMQDIIVTSFTDGGDAGGDRLSETITLNFSKVTYEYTPQKQDGSGDASVKQGFDVSANKPM